jgi:hypothetical protein
MKAEKRARARLHTLAMHGRVPEVEVGSAEHDPFLKLQAVDLCLYLTLTLLRRESCAHSIVIATNPLCKTLKFPNPTALRDGLTLGTTSTGKIRTQ